MTIRNTITAELIWGSLWRASLYGVLLGAASGGLVLDLFLPLTGSGEGGSRDAVSLGALGILVFTPMLMILFASWLTARIVAGWYAGRVCPAHPPSHGA